MKVLRLQSEEKHSTLIVVWDLISSKFFELHSWAHTVMHPKAVPRKLDKKRRTGFNGHDDPSFVPTSLLRNPTFLASQIISNVRILNLSGQNIGSDEGRHLSKCLQSPRLLNSNTFHQLVLADNNIDKLAALTLIKCALASPFLQLLDLSGNRFDPAGILLHDLCFWQGAGGNTRQWRQSKDNEGLQLILHPNVQIRHGCTRYHRALLINGLVENDVLQGMLRVLQTTSQFDATIVDEVSSQWAADLLTGIMFSFCSGESSDEDNAPQREIRASLSNICSISTGRVAEAIAQAVASYVEVQDKVPVCQHHIDLQPKPKKRWGIGGRDVKMTIWPEESYTHCRYMACSSLLELHAAVISSH
jgi:hypothetical protein